MLTRKRWLKVLPKPTCPRIPDDFTVEVRRKADGFLESYLKPTFLLPSPKDPRWNYIVEIFTARFAGRGLSRFIQKPCNLANLRDVLRHCPQIMISSFMDRSQVRHHENGCSASGASCPRRRIGANLRESTCVCRGLPPVTVSSPRNLSPQALSGGQRSRNL